MMNKQAMEANIRDLQAKQTEVEELEEEIVTEKHQIMEFDQKRNVNRECLASLNKMKKAKGEDDRLSNQKSWLFVGSFFMKLPNSNIEQIIKKEQVNLDREIEALRKSVRNKTQKWEALERSLNRSLGKMDSMDEIDDDM